MTDYVTIHECTKQSGNQIIGNLDGTFLEVAHPWAATLLTNMNKNGTSQPDKYVVIRNFKGEICASLKDIMNVYHEKYGTHFILLTN